MEFVDLDRLFAPLRKDAEPSIDWGPSWGRKYGGWLNWDELLRRRRVALLAEALSGKTEELQYRAQKLREQGKKAFFVRIEDLADDTFEGALNEQQVTAFRHWKNEELSDAWFFLDSVDEARLNNKQLALSLRKFSKEIGLVNLGRTHVLVSCRASDWKGKEDRLTLEQLLPYPLPSPGETAVLLPNEALLAPIFNRSQHSQRDSKKQAEPHPSELLVVQLSPLSDEQKKKLAAEAGLADPQGFLEAINLSGLDAMSERPGDMIDLIGYWKENNRFGTLAQMTEDGVKRKLREENTTRPSVSVISSERAREGAERLAAALIFGKTFTVKAPGQEPDPDLAPGALETRDIFPDWRQDEINALLRCGLFAPATYGRVRFHHRTSQEYLAACWLQRLLASNCPLEEVKRLLFIELYDVSTLVPTLRAVAAWLALWQPMIRDEIILREPVVLIVHGDPKSCPPEARERLLMRYATLHSTGQLNAEMIDYRATWMFSDPVLGEAVRQAWKINPRSDFRLQLLRFIEEGGIRACVDLARSTALDETESKYNRMIAARALHVCNDTSGLQELSHAVRAAPDRLDARLAPEIALVLFPGYLTTADVIDLIDRSEPCAPYQTGGFSHHLATLHSRAPGRAAKKQFAFGIAALCLYRAPLDEDVGLSRRHSELSKGLAELALAELKESRETPVEIGLVDLLMTTERAERAHDDAEELTQLAARLKSDKALNRALMWADAAVDNSGRSRKTPPTRIFQVGPYTQRRLWSTEVDDIPWLVEDCRTLPHAHERQLAFSAIYSVLSNADLLTERRVELNTIASFDTILQADLDGYRTPPEPTQYDAQHEAYRRKSEAKQQEDEQSWIDFRDQLQSDPSVLNALGALQSWKAGLFRLHDLSRWLKAHAREEGLAGVRHWHVLRSVFGDAVAEQYATAMCRVWREIKPERPISHGNGSYTTKYLTTLAIDSLAIDSANPEWEYGLTEADVDLAMKHACYAGSVDNDWVDRLIKSQPVPALKVIAAAVAVEYRSGGSRSDLLVQAAYNETPARQTVTERIFALLKASEPSDDITLERVLRILARGVAYVPVGPLKRIVVARLQAHLLAGNDKRSNEYFGLYGHLSPDGLADQVRALLTRDAGESDEQYAERVQRWLGSLFASEGRSGAATSALTEMSVASLLSLVKLAYAQVDPQMDDPPQGNGSSGRRNAAESARRHLLNVLIGIPGAEAFRALLELASDPAFTGSALRLNELAHGKAETDGDLAPWKPSEVFHFERERTAPVKTGADLLRVIMAELSNISGSFNQADASSRDLLALAQDENVVQNWLAEQLNLRARGRFLAVREPEVAQRNEPDIIVSSTTANVQIAIEVKNANKGWTVTELEDTLHGQLARDYLRVQNRRHGILVVSLHQVKTWRPPGQIWGFGQLMQHLEQVASIVVKNETGPVDVRVVGIDASEKLTPKSKSHKNSKVSN